MNRSRTILAKAALFGAALIWGSSFFIFKIAVDSIPPLLALAIRFTGASLLLAFLFHKRLKKVNADYMKSGAIIGFFLFAAYASQTIGLTDTTPGKNAFLTAVYCVIVPFLFWIVNRVRPDIYNFSAAFLCITGIGLVSLTSDLTITIGDSLTLLGGFLFASHMIAVSVCSKDKDPVLLTILQFGFAALLSWSSTFLLEALPPASVWTPGIIGSLLYLSIVCTAGALLLQNLGQKYTHPAAASILLSLESVFGVLFSVLLYGEQLTAKLLAGFLLIFAAILLSETKLSFLKKGRACAGEES